MLNYCELIALLENSISDINHSLKTLMLNSTSQLALSTNLLQTYGSTHQNSILAILFFICAKFNNKTAEKPEGFGTETTGNSFSPQQYWFMEQAVAVLATGQVHPGKDAAISRFVCFWTKDNTTRRSKVF